MKKSKIFSLILALCLCMALAAPAWAAEFSSTMLTPVNDMENVEVIVEPNDDAVSFSEEDEAQPYASLIRNEAILKEVRIYPIVYCVDEPAAYVLNDIYRVRRWNSNLVVAFGALQLSTAQVNAFMDEAFSALNSNSETAAHQWAVIGWRVESEHDLIAEKPLRLKWTPTSTCLDGTETRTINITQTNTHVTIRGNYGLPENPEKTYSVGVNGVFYAIYNGKENNVPMGGTAIKYGA